MYTGPQVDGALDFECYYDAKVSAKAVGMWTYTHDTGATPYMISWAEDDYTFVGEPKDFQWNRIQGKHLVSHNAMFDRSVFHRLQYVDRVIPPWIKPASWRCSADASAYVYGKRSLLEAVCKIFGVKLDKSVRANMEGKMPQDLTPEEMKALCQYALEDATWCLKVARDCFPKMPAGESVVSQMGYAMMERGVRIDVDSMLEYLSVVQGLQNQLCTHYFPWVCRGIGLEDVLRLRESARKDKLDYPVDAKDRGPWLDMYTDHPWVRAYLSMRAVTYLQTQLKSLMDNYRMEEETVGPEMMYFGAVTGRWTCRGFGFHGLSKHTYMFNSDGLLIKAGETAVSAVNLRKLLLARPGKVFVSLDYAQVEPKILAWQAKQTDILDQVRSGINLYIAHGVRRGMEVQKDTDEYKTVKRQVLSLGYCSGAATYLDSCPLGTKLGQAAYEVRMYRESNPEVTRYWHAMDAHIAQHAEFDLELPSGRKIRYEEIRRDEHQRGFIGTVNGQIDQRLYGGKLTAHVCQSIGRDILAEKLATLHYAGYEIAWHCHDEVIVELDEHAPTEDLVLLMELPVAWAPAEILSVDIAKLKQYT